MKVSMIDDLIKSLSDVLFYLDVNANDKIRDLIDILIDKKIELMEGWDKK